MITLNKKIILVIFPIILSLVTLFHFVIILFHVMPLNPLSNKYSHIIDGYTYPLFVQNWHLFAPEPISSNRIIQMKTQTNGENSEWIDITTPFIDGNHKNYFSPYNRISRLSSGVIQQLFEEDEITLKYEEKTKKIEKKIEEKEQFKTGKEIIFRYASSYANFQYPNNNIEMIKIRIIRKDSIPFSERSKLRKNNFNKFKDWESIYEFNWEPKIEISPIL
ncbi:DUF5819 family protein [Peribacillus sp. YIM B13482]|uniref:DUF5819 family protein n=2 Tax=Peribacillus simplex TaxID=1478 RepID=A0AAW7IJ24_9BACI|nr:DUF5819 family protein [Peribacillus simplex]